VVTSTEISFGFLFDSSGWLGLFRLLILARARNALECEALKTPANGVAAAPDHVESDAAAGVGERSAGNSHAGFKRPLPLTSTSDHLVGADLVVRRATPSHLAASQLPDPVSRPNGTPIAKPANW